MVEGVLCCMSSVGSSESLMRICGQKIDFTTESLCLCRSNCLI